MKNIWDFFFYFSAEFRELDNSNKNRNSAHIYIIYQKKEKVLHFEEV
jgi:hypothetical protein